MLNFPSSPVDGQQYDQWVYSSAKGAWLAKPLEPMAAVPSPVAPAFPQPGDMWFNTNEATTYVYYDDGNSSQWVEMVAQTGLPQPLAIAQGGTGATTVADAQDLLRVGLVPISPTSVEKAGASSTATANTLGQVTFASCASVSLNGVFSAAYKNYRIMIRITDSTATSNTIAMRLRQTADNTSTAYSQGVPLATNSGTTTAIIQNGSQNWIAGQSGSTVRLNTTAIDIFNPFASTYTTLTMTMLYHTDNAWLAGGGGGYHSENYSASGFSLIPGTAGSTIGGTVQVFGYNE